MSTPSPIPDWLEDVRQVEKPSAVKQTPPVRGLPLDWLDDIRQIEESLRARPTPPLSARPEVNGFDPTTGRILDPVAYERWQKTEAQRRQQELQQQPTLSVAEAFLDAQRAIQTWVDDEKNKPLVTSGDLATIRQCGSVQEILHRYEGYGPVMQEKLWKRLAFLVDNRQKFFKAFDKKA